MTEPMDIAPDPWWLRTLRWAGGLWMWVITSPLILLALLALGAGAFADRYFIGSALAYICIAAAGYSVGKKKPRRAVMLLGAGASISAFWLTGYSPLIALILVACAMAGGWMLWGGDTLIPKAPPPGPYVAPADPAITNAQADLARVDACVRRVSVDTAMRLYGIVSEARGILAEAQKDPVDLARARRFLVVHVAMRAPHAERAAEGKAPDNFLSLLNELHTAATELRKRLHDADRESIEIQVEVLSRRLKEEGLA